LQEYVKILSVRWEDQFNWIDWFIWENACGKNKLGVKLDDWDEYKEITTVEELADLFWGEKECG
jgi:hypothetical protein